MIIVIDNIEEHDPIERDEGGWLLFLDWHESFGEYLQIESYNVPITRIVLGDKI